MDNGFEMNLTGIFDELKTINKSPSELKKIAEEAMNIVDESTRQEAPYKTGRTKRSVKRISHVRIGGAEVTSYVDTWYAASLNDGNSKIRKHAGWYERAINNAEEETFAKVEERLGF